MIAITKKFSQQQKQEKKAFAKKQAVDRNKFFRKLCRDSFYDFVRHFWFETSTEPPVWNWHIKELCQILQHAAERVFKRLPKEHDYIINIPPGTTKSTICSVMYPAWILSRMPSAQMICASFTEKLSLELSQKSRRIVKAREYRTLFPWVQLRKDQDTKHLWQTTRGGWRFSATVGGANPTGFHGHFLIVDDPIDPQESRSEVKIATANEFMDLTLSQRKVSQLITVTILIMQRLHQNDPTGNRLEHPSRGKVYHVCLPAELNEHVKPKRYRHKYKDGLLDPVRLPHSVLDTKKGNPFLYAGQYMQHPVPMSGGMFHTIKLNLGVPPALAKFKRLWRYWDKAGTKDAGCFTAGVLMGETFDGVIWVLDVVRGQWEAATREKQIKMTAQMDGKKVRVGLEVEPGSSGKESAQNTANNLLGWIVKQDRVTGDKIERAEPFASAVNNELIHVPLGAPWLREYIAEMQFFPDSTYKDQMDASSGSYNMLTQNKVRIGVFK